MNARTSTVPKSWQKYCQTDGNFECGIDNDISFGGQKSAFIKSVGDAVGPKESCLLYQTVCADPYKDKRVRLTGKVKTDAVSNWAGFSLSVYGGNILYGYDNMLDRRISGTTDWTDCELVLNVPQEATSVSFAAVLDGSGEVWIANLAVDVVGEEVPATDDYAEGCLGLWQPEPQNLELTQNADKAQMKEIDFLTPVKHWLIWQNPDKSYKFSPDKNCLFDGRRSLHIESASKKGSFGSVFQKFASVRYRSKRIKFSAFIKTENVVDGVSLWMDVITTSGDSLIGGQKFSEQVIGSQSWIQREVVVDVPLEGFVISLGARLDGPGAMWIGGLQFQKVGKDVDTTAVSIKKTTRLPVNLDFEEGHDHDEPAGDKSASDEASVSNDRSKKRTAQKDKQKVVESNAL